MPSHTNTHISGNGHAIFADRLAQFAGDVDEPGVSAVAHGVGRGVTVSVRGRAGVGRGAVARALAAAGVPLSGDGDVDVHVIAEVVKPEDRVVIAASALARPTLVVLNKADLGFGRNRSIAALTGLPTVPMAAHLAVAQIDDVALSALRTLAAEPCELGSVDGFVTGAHPLPAQVRMRLLETLDLSGVTHATMALRAWPDCGAADVRRILRRYSGIDGAVAALARMIVEAGYRRVRSAAAALEAIVATDAGLAAQVAAFLNDDDTVIACMAAAVEVVEAAGMTVDPGDDGAAHLRRATHWHRYGRGPVNAMHRACGADIVRGSLRLWRQARTRQVTS